jgi:hypothetical protein
LVIMDFSWLKQSCNKFCDRTYGVTRRFAKLRSRQQDQVRR